MNNRQVNRTRHLKQRGVSLPMLVIAIAVSAILGLVAIIYGPRLLDQTKAENERIAMTDTKASVVKYGAKVGTFTAANTTVPILISQGVFPRPAAGGTDVQNQWGGTMTFAVGTVATAGDALVVSSPGFPEGPCVDISTGMDRFAARVLVGTTEVKALGAASNLETARTACAAGGDNNTLVVTFSR